MAPTISIDPKFLDLISELKLSETGIRSSQRLLQIQNGILYLWFQDQAQILAYSFAGKETLVITLTDTPLFDVEQLQVSPSGRWVCLSGPSGVSMVELPKRLTKKGKFLKPEPDETDIICRSFPLAQKFFMANSKIVVQKVTWHPGSIYDNYLVALTSDNYLRIYNLEDTIGHAEQNINLSPSSPGESARTFGESALTLKGSIGETAVDFTFGPTVSIESGDESEENNFLYNLWPAFVLHGNGNVFCLLSGLGKHAPPANQRILGPLPMFPDASDNYGLESCSILCLHPTISSPPVLVIAANGGTIYHCVVLHQTEESDVKDDDNQSQVSDWSSSAFGRNPNDSKTPDLSLYIYESVELELALTSDETSGSKESRPFDYPIFLHSDPSTPARYFCTHKAGIHSVKLPMVSQLADLAQKDDGGNNVLAEQQSYVEHLVCTQMSTSSVPAPILGLAISSPPSSLVYYTSDYELQILELSSPYFIEPLPFPVAGEAVIKSAPIRQDHDRIPFDKLIAKMLQKSVTQPLLKGQAGVEVSNEMSLKILARTLRVLREEYIFRMESVRVKIEQKSDQLISQKTQQQASLSQLNGERLVLREKAAQLSERYEDMKDNGERLAKRIEKIIQHIQSNDPANTDAQLRMERHLKTLNQKLKNMQNGLDQIHSKEKYQFRQIWQESQNLIQYRSPKSAKERMSKDQLSSVKKMLEQDSQSIGELVRDIHSVRNCLETS